MKAKANVVEILDEARAFAGCSDRLMRLVYVLAGNVTHRSEIVQEALIEIAKKFSAGETSISLEKQLRGVVKTCAKRIRSADKKAVDRIGDTGEEVGELIATETSDPAALLVRLEEFDEKIELLTKLREMNPRQFEALVADWQDVSIAEHFKEKFDDTVTPVNARKMRERARLKLNTGLEQIRKDSPS